jgi:hypothetical protein
MRIIPIGLLAGVGSVALIGAAAAQDLSAHRIAVQLPSGAIEQIEYTGDLAPQITIAPPESAAPANGTEAALFRAPYDSFAGFGFGPNSPFAAMAQISAAMNREAASLMRQVDALAAQPMMAMPAPIVIDMARLPRGAEGYSFTATITPNGACRRTMTIIGARPGQQPRVIRRSEGSCGSAGGLPAFDRAPYRTVTQRHRDVRSVKGAHRAVPQRRIEQVAWHPY